WSVFAPIPGREGDRQRNISEGGGRRQADEIPARTGGGVGRQTAEKRDPMGGEAVHCGRRDGESQQQPQEPRRPVGPEGQRQEAPPVGDQTGIERVHAVGGIKRERRDDGHAEKKWRAEPQRSVGQKLAASLASETGPGEES